MLNIEECRKLAADHLRQLGSELELYQEPIHSGEYGWVFGYQSREFIRTGAISDALAGNAPLLVDKRNHQVHVLGTAEPTEFYLENYASFGDPHKVPGAKIELIGAREEAQKASAIHQVKKRSNLGLGEAKRAVDKCLSRKSVVIECSTISDAALLLHELEQLGFDARQVGE